MNPTLALVIAYVIWGAAAPITKLALQDVPPFIFGFLRFFFAGSIYLIFVLKKWKNLTPEIYIQVIIGALFGVVVNKAFFFLGLQRAPSVYAPIIASLSPLLLYVGSVLFLHEKQNRSLIIGIALSFIGLCFIVLSPLMQSAESTTWKNTLLGSLFLLFAVSASVAQTIFHKRILASIDALQVTFISFFVGAVSFAPFALIELEAWSFSQLDMRGIFGITYGIVFGSALAYGLFMHGISRLKAQQVGIYSYISPVIALLVAIPLLGELPNVYFYLGAILIAVGMTYAEHRHTIHISHKL